MIATNEINALCAKNKTTKAQLARVIGISEKTLYTKMKKGIFGSDELEKMAKYFRVNINQFFLLDN